MNDSMSRNTRGSSVDSRADGRPAQCDIGISRRLTLLCATILAIACSSDTTAPDDVAESLASATPNAVSASAATDVIVNLNWQDRATVETGFEVHRSSTGADGTFLLVATLPANTTSFPDAERAPLTAYCYQVRAVRNTGGRLTYSPFSSTACATTFGPPGAPTNLRARPDSGAVFVSWTAAPTAVRYRVERSASVSGPWVLLGEALNDLELMDRNQVFEQQVCYRVASQGPYGESAASPVCTTPPAPPTLLAATARPTGGIDLTWTDRSAVEDGFEILRTSNWPPDGFVTIGAVPANAAGYHDATAINNTRYWYWVYAKKDGGNTRSADGMQALNSTVAPDAPSNVSALPQSSTGALVLWLGSSGNETVFTVERSTNGGAWVPVGTTPWGTMWYGDAGLTPDVQVCYRVLTVNDRGNSPPSVEDCTAPPRAPTNLVATPAEQGTIALTWRDESSVEEGYDVQRVVCFDNDDEWGNGCATTIATVGPGVTSFRVTGLTPGVVDMYRVVAFRIRGVRRGYSDPSNNVSAAAPPE